MKPRLDRGGASVCGLPAFALGAWTALTPFLATPDVAWGERAGGAVLAVVPGAVAALGGLGMLAGLRRAGALLVLAGGLSLVVWPVAGGFAGLGDGGVPLLQWIVYYAGAGAMLAALAAYVLGWLDAIPVREPPLTEVRSARACAATSADAPRRTRRVVVHQHVQRPQPGHRAPRALRGDR